MIDFLDRLKTTGPEGSDVRDTCVTAAHALERAIHVVAPTIAMAQADLLKEILAMTQNEIDSEGSLEGFLKKLRRHRLFSQATSVGVAKPLY